jgi:hypothetical protein
MRALRLAVMSSAFALVTLLSAASAGGADGRTASGSGSLEPAIQHALRGPCVAEPALMRRQHPDLLKHQRLETVHLGVREARASLKACVGCHASTETGSVAAAPTDFCVSCHSYAAVQVDCFECHASKPEGPRGPGHP